MKKVVIQLAILDEKDKKKVLRAVSGLSGVDSIALDMKDKKLTVLGDVDPVEIVGKLRKTWHPDLLLVGPAKEPEKKEDDKKKNTAPTESEQVADLIKFYKSYSNNAYMAQSYHYNPPYHYNSEDNPNSCVIC